MNRRKIVVGNWKMNRNLHEAILLADDIRKAIETLGKNQLPGIVLAPPFPFLYPVSQTLGSNLQIAIGAQNCSAEQQGAYTGEVSADMIRSTGARFVLVGHSERRALFGENDEVLSRKVLAALKSELTPIFCVGEQLEERKSNRHFGVVDKQLQIGLFGLPEELLKKIIIAYEPIWAIGTGMTASSIQAQEMHAHIRSLIQKTYSIEISENISILYGGSCNPSNARELFACQDVDGGLIGGASLKAADFVSIIKAAI
jgi:triosephosphate isomerase